MMASGEQSVMIISTEMQPWLCVVNLALTQLVHWQCSEQDMGRVQVKFGWIMSGALDQKITLALVQATLGDLIIVAILKTLV